MSHGLEVRCLYTGALLEERAYELDHLSRGVLSLTIYFGT